MRLTDICQKWLSTSLKHGDIAIDATLGNGFDALFLAQHIGPEGTLFGFDVQQQAINNSVKLLEKQPCKKYFFLKGHETLAATIPSNLKGNIQAVMFNLGWLPNSDKSIITRSHTTISALKQSIEWLAIGGKMSVMVYPGHEGGDKEAEDVITWLEQEALSQPITMSVEKMTIPNRPTAPILLKVSKH